MMCTFRQKCVLCWSHCCAAPPTDAIICCWDCSQACFLTYNISHNCTFDFPRACSAPAAGSICRTYIRKISPQSEQYNAAQYHGKRYCSFSTKMVSASRVINLKCYDEYFEIITTLCICLNNWQYIKIWLKRGAVAAGQPDTFQIYLRQNWLS